MPAAVVKRIEPSAVPEARSAGVPSASIRPRSMMTTWSARRSASSSSWVVRITQMPRVALVGDDVAHHDASLGVDAGGGLVEEEHLGLAHQGQRQRESLLLPAGQPPPRGAPDRAEADPLEEVVGVLGVVVVGGEEVEDLGRAEHGVDAAPLQHHPDAGHQGGVVGGAGRGRAPGPSRRRAGGSPRGPRRCWSCRRRWARAAPPPGRRRADEREPVDGHSRAVADDHLVAVDGRRSEPVPPCGERGHVVHGGSRYRCPRHDRYPQWCERTAPR